jgi:hypothetical protein
VVGAGQLAQNIITPRQASFLLHALVQPGNEALHLLLNILHLASQLTQFPRLLRDLPREALDAIVQQRNLALVAWGVAAMKCSKGSVW